MAHALVKFLLSHVTFFRTQGGLNTLNRTVINMCCNYHLLYRTVMGPQLNQLRKWPSSRPKRVPMAPGVRAG